MSEPAPPAPHLRPARIEDLDVVLPWAPDAEAMRLWAGPAVGFPVPRATLWAALWQVPGAAFALCEADERVVGFGQLMHREPGFAHLARIIVAPAHRGRGLGRLLCRALMQAAPARLPVRAFSLHVHPENHRARALYRSLGFVEVRTERKVLRMEKLLDSAT